MNDPKATSEMMIRKPVHVVFEALVNPEITYKFWFTKGSARLEAGKSVEWKWGQFGVSAAISVTEIKQNQLIQFQWPASEVDNYFRTVEITFEAKSKETTFVQVKESGFKKKSQSLVEQIAGQTEGWALVLSAMKAYLEFGIDLKLIADHKPKQTN